MIIAKLEWFRLDWESSDRQRGDIVAMLKTGAERLDYDYLASWAGGVAVGDLLKRARQEGGQDR